MSAGRLAPTPSGDLHLGNVTAFAAAWLSARQAGTPLLLRMEDVDTGRARPEVEARQRATLQWLGLDWDRETPRQSERRYDSALEKLGDLAYRCECSRRAIRAADGRCGMGCADKPLTHGALRLRTDDTVVAFTDRRHGPQRIASGVQGDPVLVRSDGLVAYPLAVVVDDVRDGVSEVVRGDDLLQFTAPQLLLWHALGGVPPTWCHTPLVLGPDGRKLGKSHGSISVDALRDTGWAREHILRCVLGWLGCPTPHLHEAVAHFDPALIPTGSVQITSGVNVPPDALTWMLCR